MRQENNFNSVAIADISSRLGLRLRAARRARKESLIDLEKRVRVHRTTLGRLERGDLNVSLAVLMRVLEALGVLSDLELLVSRPEQLGWRGSITRGMPDLPTDF